MSAERIRKVFWFDYGMEKREAWLNEMAAKGLNAMPTLSFTGFISWRFEQGEPGQWIYRIELLPKDHKHAESIRYMRFMQDAGVECVLSMGRTAVFRKPAADGPFELFSDLSSRIGYLRRIRKAILWSIVFAVYWLALSIIYMMPPTDPIMTPFMQVTGVLWVPTIAMLAYQALGMSKRIRSLEAQRQVGE